MTQLLKKIRTDLNQALKAKKTDEVSVLRFLLSALHNKEIALRQAPTPAEASAGKQGKKLTDEEVIAIIRKQIKQRKESINEFEKGKRDDLVQKERGEMKILSKYLPQMISPQELEEIVNLKIKQLGTKGKQDFGKVMAEVMKEVKGKADGEEVARLVKERLA
jgi:uncharacterized protein YqeY